jgi:hypothetical protein
MKIPLKYFRFLRGNIKNEEIIKEFNLFYKLDKNKWNKRILVFFFKKLIFFKIYFRIHIKLKEKIINY